LSALSFEITNHIFSTSNFKAQRQLKCPVTGCPETSMNMTTPLKITQKRRSRLQGGGKMISLTVCWQ